MFKKSLQDMVKGIRNAKREDKVYIAQCLNEIRKEAKSPDVAVKAQALQKITYVRAGAPPALPAPLTCACVCSAASATLPVLLRGCTVPWSGCSVHCTWSHTP